MPIISGAKLQALKARLAMLLDADTMRLRGEDPIPAEVLAAEPCDDPAGQPGQHRFHIAREPMPEKTSGGIHIPVQVRETDRLTKGWIIAASPSANGGEPEACLGMKVMFGRYAGGTILIEQESDLYLGSFLSIREGDIWAILPNDLED